MNNQEILQALNLADGDYWVGKATMRTTFRGFICNVVKLAQSNPELLDYAVTHPDRRNLIGDLIDKSVFTDDQKFFSFW